MISRVDKTGQSRRWLRGQDFAARITLALKLNNFSDRGKLQVLAQSLDSLMSPGILARGSLPLKAELSPEW